VALSGFAKNNSPPAIPPRPFRTPQVRACHSHLALDEILDEVLQEKKAG
jgi:hypothetical protein